MTAYMTLYDATGKITGEAWCQDSVMPMIVENMGNVPFQQGHIMGKYFDQADTKYVVDGVLTDRPVQSTVLIGNTLSGLPVPSKITVNKEVYECTEDVATLEFNLPGTYRILISSWPYIDKEFNYVNPA